MFLWTLDIAAPGTLVQLDLLLLLYRVQLE